MDALPLLIRLIGAHLAADFLLQPNWGVKQRQAKNWASIWLYVHGILAGGLVYLFSGLWRTLWLPVTIAVTHIIIDGLKARARDTTGIFLLDQGVHFAIIVACWGLLTDPSALWLYLIRCIQDVRCWIIAVSYIAVIWPAGILVGKLTGQWRKKSDPHSSSKTPGLDRGGLLIGRLERFLILTFVLLNHYEAIGFLIAAKSVFRFSELHEQAEYIIIGSMASFSIAVALGIGARYLLGL
jgi:Protein of unknown function (DUF3307)